MKKIKNILYNIWRLIYPIVLYFVMVYIVQWVYGFCLAIIEGTNNKFELMLLMNKHLMSMQMTANLVSALILWFFMHKDEKKRKMQENVTYSKPGVEIYLITIILGFSAAVAGNGIIILSGIGKLFTKFNHIAQIMYSDSLLIQTLTLVFSAPLLEEILIRGLIYKRLREHIPALASMIISSVMFGVIHGNMLQFVYATALGMIMAYIYEKSKTILMPILFHMGANAFTVLYTAFVPEEYVTMPIVIVITIIMTVVTVLLMRVFRHKSDSIKPMNKPVREEETYGDIMGC